MGVEFHPNEWFSLNLAADYSYVRLFGQNIHTIRERLGLRFSF